MKIDQIIELIKQSSNSELDEDNRIAAHLALKRLSIQYLRSGEPWPPLLAWYLALKLEDVDTEFLNAKEKTEAKRADRTALHYDIAWLYEYLGFMPIKKRRALFESGNKMEIVMAQFEVSEDIVKAARKSYSDLAKDLKNLSKVDVSPILKRLVRHYASPFAKLTRDDILRQVTIREDIKGILLKDGNFILETPYGGIIYRSFSERLALEPMKKNPRKP